MIEKITHGGVNVGCYKSINGQNGSIKGSAFLVNGATEVHNLTMYELNKARNKKNGSVDDSAFGLYHSSANFLSEVTTVNDAAKGLFKLNDLDNYNLNKKIIEYWLATPEYNYTDYLRLVYSDGSLHSYYDQTSGLRPVIMLPPNAKLEVIGN